MASPVDLSSQSSYTELVYKRHRAVTKKLKKIADIEEKTKASGARVDNDQLAVLSKKPELLVLHKEFESLKDKYLEFDAKGLAESSQPAPADYTKVADLVLALAVAGQPAQPTEKRRAAAECLHSLFGAASEHDTPQTATAATADLLAAYASGEPTVGGVPSQELAEHVASLVEPAPASSEDEAPEAEPEVEAAPPAAEEPTAGEETPEAAPDATEPADEGEEVAAAPTVLNGFHSESAPPPEDIFQTEVPSTFSAPAAVVKPIQPPSAPAATEGPGFEFMGPSIIDEAQRLANDAVFNDPAIVQVTSDPTPPPSVSPATIGSQQQPPPGAAFANENGSHETAPPAQTAPGAGRTTAQEDAPSNGQWQSRGGGRGGKERGRGKKGGRGRGEQAQGGRGRGDQPQGGRGRGDNSRGRGRGRRGRGGRGGGGGRGDGGAGGADPAAATGTTENGGGAWGKPSGRGRANGTTPVTA